MSAPINATNITWSLLKMPLIVSAGFTVVLIGLFEVFRRVSHTSFLYDGRNRRRLDNMQGRCPKLPLSWHGLDWLHFVVDEGGGVRRCSLYEVFKSSLRNFGRHFRIFFHRSNGNLLGVNQGDVVESSPADEERGAGINGVGEKSFYTPIIRTSLSNEDTLALSSRESELFRLIGLDSYSFLRYLRFGFNISFYPFVFSACILFPIYATEPNPPDLNPDGSAPFAAVTVQHLPVNSRRMWAANVIAILFYIYALRLLWIEWEFFVSLRLKFLARGDEHGNKEEAMAFRKTVLVERLNGLGTGAIKATFVALFRDQVDSAEVVPDTTKLDALIADRLVILKKHEDLVAKEQYFRENPRYFLTRWNPKSDMKLSKSFQTLSRRHLKQPSEVTEKAMKGDECKIEKTLDIYLNVIEALNKEIEEEAESVNSNTRVGDFLDVGFVKFKSAAARQVSLSTVLFNGNKMLLKEAPEAKDIIWANFYQPTAKQNMANYLYSSILLGGLLVVIPFSVVVSAFQNAETLDSVDWIGISAPDKNTHPIQYSLFTGLLPPTLWIVFMSIAYGLIKVGAFFFIRFRTYTQVNAYTFKFFYLYQLVGFLSIIIGGSITTAWADLSRSPTDFWKATSKAVVDQAAFFLSYAIIRVSKNFLDLSLLLSLLRKLFLRLKRNKKGSSQRKVDAWMFPEGLNVNRMLPMMSFLILISVTYVVMIPFASLIVAISFWCSCKVYKYLTLFVCGKKFEGGGRVVFQGLQQLPISFIVTQVLWIGYLVVQKNPICAGVFAPMVLVTVIVRIKINKHFVNISKVMTLAAATAIDLEELRDGTMSESDGIIDDCYVSPSLRRDKWETQPLPYRRKNVDTKISAFGLKKEFDMVSNENLTGHLAASDESRSTHITEGLMENQL